MTQPDRALERRVEAVERAAERQAEATARTLERIQGDLEQAQRRLERIAEQVGDPLRPGRGVPRDQQGLPEAPRRPREPGTRTRRWGRDEDRPPWEADPDETPRRHGRRPRPNS